jgi:hypothetical protein
MRVSVDTDQMLLEASATLGVAGGSAPNALDVRFAQLRITAAVSATKTAS